MKKKALKKDFYMEIRKSMGRFLSIFFIVAIGCAFFAGIRSSEPDMRYSGDAYFDMKNQMGTYEKKTLTVTLGKKSDAPSTSSNSSNSNSNSNNSNSYNNNYNNESSNSQYYSFGQ